MCLRMAKTPCGLILGIGLLFSLNVVGVERQNHQPCLEPVLTDVQASANNPSLGFWARFRARFSNTDNKVRFKDRSTIKKLIKDGIIKPESIKYLGTSPDLQGFSGENILLLSKTGDAIKITRSEMDPSHALLQRQDRIYLVELNSAQATGRGRGDPLSVRFQIPVESEYQEGVKWKALSQEDKERLNKEFGNRRMAPANYRDGGQIEAVPIRVQMPTGKVFTQVDEPAFRDLGLSWRDEQTKLTWSQTLKEKMGIDRATAACKQLGARLPTSVEVSAWIKHVGEYGGRRYHLFPPDAQWYWSWSMFDPYHSDDVSKRGSGSYKIQVYGHWVEDDDRAVSAAKFSVRCVR